MLIAKVRNFITTNGLLSHGDRVLAAVSGGPDSVALLNVLAELRTDMGFRLYAAHVNHGLRPEAQDEERFVLAMCEKLGVECAVGTVDPRSLAAESGCSLEEAGRELRHRFLAEHAQELSARLGMESSLRPRVATGHTLDDQAETVLMRLIRGAGVRGLSAMRPVSERFSTLAVPGAIVIRPLLSSTRQEVLEFLQSRQIPCVEDASNFDMAFLRNRVRHELLPMLKERYNPGIVDGLGSQAELLNEADEYLTLTGRKAYEECVSGESAERIELELPRLVAYHVCVQGYVFREAYFRLIGTLRDIGFSHIASLSRLVSAGRPGDRVDLPHGAAAMIEGTNLVLGLRAAFESERECPCQFSVEHEPGGRTWLPEISLGVESRVLRREDLKECPGVTPGRDRAGGTGPADATARGTAPASEVFFDLEALSPPLVLRSLRPGDRLNPFGMQGSKKIQDLLVDMKVPRRARRNLAALCDGSGILWLVGLRRSSAAPVKESTKVVLAARTFDDK